MASERQIIRAMDEEETPEGVQARRTELGIVPTVKPHVFGTPLDEFMKGGPAAFAAQYTSPAAVAATQQEATMFPQQDMVSSLWSKPPKLISDNLAANRAHAEEILAGQDMFNERMLRNKQGLVQDEALRRLVEIDQESMIQSIVDDPELDLVAKQEAIQYEILRQDFRKLDPYTNLLFQYMLIPDGGLVPIEQFQKRYREVPGTVLQSMTERLTEQQIHRARLEVDDLAAANGFRDYAHMFGNVAVQDFVPVWNVLTRIGFNTKLLEASGAPIDLGWRGFFTGEIRQTIREHLVSLSPEERNRAVISMKQMVEALQRDETYGPLLTTYNVLEAWQAIFSDDVLLGKSSDDSWDRWLGNLEVALESVFSVMAIAKLGGRGLRGEYRSTDAVRARQIARLARNSKVLRGLDALMQQDAKAAKFQLSTDSAVVAQLPRPAIFADDLDAIPNGVKNTVRESENIRSEILAASTRITGNGLNIQDKFNAIRREIEDIDMLDGMEVQTRMSTIKLIDDGSGYEITATIGQAADKGWDDFEEMIQELIQLDPTLEAFTIMRVNKMGILEPMFINKDEFLRAVFKGEVPSGVADEIFGSDEFYVQYKVARQWHPMDKVAFGEDAIVNTTLNTFVLNPNAKFGDEIAGAFNRAHMDEQMLVARFERMFEPFYALNNADKRVANSVYEWMEDFGKNNGRAPTLTETYSQFGNLTPKQMSGVVALRSGLDTLYEVFNARLHVDWSAAGYKTAKSLDGALPTYHGKVIDEENLKGGWYYNPATGELENLKPRDLLDIYNAGGRAMKLDIPVDVPGARASSKADQIILREDAYQVGPLSTRPLAYHPGYSVRFYDDPFYVIKRTSNVTVNGAKSNKVYEEAIRTAGSRAEAEHWAKRANYRERLRRGDRGAEFAVVRAADIDVEEGKLFQKQTLNREGRLFWDTRNFDRLPDVNGNRAKLEDPVVSLERAIAIAMRQHTHEDIFRGIKNAFDKDYGQRLGLLPVDKYKSLKVLSDDLGRDIRNASGDAAKVAELKKAKSIIDYLRGIQGLDTKAVPFLRGKLIGGIAAIQRALGKAGRKGKLASAFKSMEKFAESMDPFRAARSTAFKVFMVTRPARQALMQMMQISFLSGLKPSYVLTPQFIRDGYNLRNGAFSLLETGFDDGVSLKRRAKAMKLSEKEARKLFKEFSRSGLMDMVNVHSFSGARKSGRKSPIPESAVDTALQTAKRPVAYTMDRLQRYGFDLGEQMNVAFTYNLALRRMMDKKKAKSLLELTDEDWNELRLTASNLALAMTKPNQFAYQQGVASLATQFLSFSHKALLSLAGQNPALKGTDVLRVWGATTMLFGASMFGARDFVEEVLYSMGADQWGESIVPGIGVTVIDLISAGLIENAMNGIGDMLSREDEWKDLDLSFLAPGFDIGRFIDMNMTTILQDPIAGFFGPFTNIASKTMKAYDFAAFASRGNPQWTAAEKATFWMDAMARGVFPGYNDAMMAYIAYQTGRWISSKGDPLPLEASWNAMVARGMFGSRTREELAYYRFLNEVWESDSDVRDIAKATKEHLKKMITSYGDKQITYEDLTNQVAMIAHIFEEWPEGRRLEVLNMVYTDDLEPGVPTIFEMMLEAFGDGKLDRQAIQNIRNIDGMPETVKEQLINLLEEAWTDRLIEERQTPDRLRSEHSLSTNPEE